MKLVILLAVVLLEGCSSLQTIRGGLPLEAAWQVSNAVDFSQTITIARNPEELHEENPILGRHPSSQAVGAYWAAYSLLHLAVASWLARTADATGERGWEWAFYGFEVLTLYSSTRTVAHNYAIGIHMFSGPDIYCAVRGPHSCLSWLRHRD